MMLRKFIIGSPKEPAKDAYVWNMIGGMLDACQSALLLLVISHTNTVEDAGVYTIAYAIASLAITLGKYGVRNYQVSDVYEKYSFRTYVQSRIVTSILMVAVVLYYMARGFFILGYEWNKVFAIMIMGVTKLVDAVEDVFHARLQQIGRLDVGAKCITFRYIGIILIICIVLFVTHKLIIAFIVGSIFSWVFFLWTYQIYRPLLLEEEKDNSVGKDVLYLLIDCFAIAVCGYLSIYVANAPKYAIDAQMTEAAQARFNYIFMPVYMISTLSTFIFQPLIAKMSYYLGEGKIEELIGLFFRIIAAIILICVAVYVGSYLFGIPLLSFMYNSDLSGYKKEFMTLLLGGGMLAFSSFFSVCIVILRQQKMLLVGYIVPVALELIFIDNVAQSYGIYGVSILYTGLMFLQCLIFFVILIYSYIIYYRYK